MLRVLGPKPPYALFNEASKSIAAIGAEVETPTLHAISGVG